MLHPGFFWGLRDDTRQSRRRNHGRHFGSRLRRRDEFPVRNPLSASYPGRFGILRARFSPGTESASLGSGARSVDGLSRPEANVRAFDPEARTETHRIYGDRDNLTLCDGAYQALEGADVLAIVTEWK